MVSTLFRLLDLVPLPNSRVFIHKEISKAEFIKKFHLRVKKLQLIKIKLLTFILDIFIWNLYFYYFLC